VEAAKVDFIASTIDQRRPPMKDSDLRFNILVAAALGIGIVLAPTAGRAPQDEASGPYIGAGVGQSDVDTDCAVAGTETTGCDTTNTAWKAYLGYQFNKWIALEGGYVKFGDVNATGSVVGTPSAQRLKPTNPD
jgi:opacity protein-like surface antigen